MRTRLIFCAGLLLMLVLSAVIFHLGPSLHSSRTGRVVDSMQLSDGSRLILVQRPNDNLVEAYTVVLFRRYTNGQVEKCQIGFEESYWWMGSLKQKGGKLIDVRSLGASLCTYDSEKKVLTWNDNSYPKRESSSPVYINIPEDNRRY
jgi:hypothetical protein